MIICDKTTMNAAIIFIALSWFAIGYVVANARMINQAIEKGLAYRDSEGRFCWKEYYQLKREFEESKKMKKRKYYYNHPFPIDTMRN